MAGIYVHIPYCHAKCAYCDFFSTPVLKSAKSTVEGIIAEYRMRIRELDGHKIDTIYFGGGTPSSLPTELLQRITAALPMNVAIERTIEVNPEDVNADTSQIWRELGFNRISMGVQSLVDAELAFVGRRHSASDALNAIDILRTAGFDNISCDLIYGLPGQTAESWKHSLHTLVDTGIEHLSAYSLSYEPGTRLFAMLEAGRITPVDDDIVAEMYNELCAKCTDAGLEHYEISNFARSGMRSRHNSSYWNATPYLGLGPGAHSYDKDGIRRSAPHNIAKWLQNGPEIEHENPIEQLNDLIITGLRTSDGLDTNTLPLTEKEALLRRARTYINRGMVKYSGTSLSIPEQHWLVSDGIMRDLMAE